MAGEGGEGAVARTWQLPSSPVVTAKDDLWCIQLTREKSNVVSGPLVAIERKALRRDSWSILTEAV